MLFFRDETSDKPKENRIVKFHDEATERGRSAQRVDQAGTAVTSSQRGGQVAAKAKSLLRTSTSILKVNILLCFIILCPYIQYLYFVTVNYQCFEKNKIIA